MSSVKPEILWSDTHKVALNADGSVALAVWAASSDSRHAEPPGVTVARRTSAGWTNTVLAPEQEPFGDVNLALDDSGDVAWLVWDQSTSTTHDIVATQWSADSWQQPKVLSTHGLWPQIAVSGDGSLALAAWVEVGSQYEGSRLQAVWWNKGEWGTSATVYQTDVDLHLDEPRLAMDAAGNSPLLSWYEVDSSGERASGVLYATRWSAGWDTPTLIVEQDTINGSPPQVALTDDGSVATIMWEETGQDGVESWWAETWNGDVQDSAMIAWDAPFATLARGATSTSTRVAWVTAGQDAHSDHDTASLFTKHWEGSGWSDDVKLFHLPDASTPYFKFAQSADGQTGLFAMSSSDGGQENFFAIARERADKTSLVGTAQAKRLSLVNLAMSKDGSHALLGWLDDRWRLAQFGAP
jgi:hypothetical protein